APSPAKSSNGRREGGRTLVELRGVGLVYAKGTPWAHRALQGVDLTVKEGESILVTGENGSGKTTLAWVLAGLLAPTEGMATLEGQPIARCVGRVGMAFQHARLQLFRTTVAGDVAFGRHLDQSGVATALEEVGLDPACVAPRRIDELSGGEQRRVALAGLVAARPRLIVLDEPLAGLDATAARVLLEGLDRLRTLDGIATLVVSHDLEMAPALGERHITMAGGQLADDRATISALSAKA
ncbi:MAG: energy-coupling factor ABC transporter ATP-binding protein, partial [Acidimicrobiales bacterium]